jgi:hypothetical protein
LRETLIATSVTAGGKSIKGKRKVWKPSLAVNGPLVRVSLDRTQVSLEGMEDVDGGVVDGWKDGSEEQ